MIINYSKILKNNLEKVLYDVLLLVSKNGFKESHHLYITFDTNKKGVKISKTIKEKYKNEITIVIQNEYWNLKVNKYKFSVDLSFNNITANIVVPFNAVLSFADPYANFGLQISSNKTKKIKIKTKTSHIKTNKIIKLDQYRKN